MWSCNCLNIIIKTETNDFQKVNGESLNLNEEELRDSFFNQDIQQVAKLVDINKVHSGLVQARHVGSWTIFHCINCDMDSYAVHREKGASCLIINSQLLTTDTIKSLQGSNFCSYVYKIVVNPKKVDPDVNLNNTYLSSDVESVLKDVKQKMADAIGKEADAVDERINKYKEEQYDYLNKLRLRAFEEQENLIKVIINSAVQKQQQQQNKKQKPDSTNNKMTLPGSLEGSARLKLLLSNNLPNNLGTPIKGNLRHSPKRQKSSSSNNGNSFDAEGLFEFDGIDDDEAIDINESDDNREESDAEEMVRDEGISFQRNRTAGISCAKSLPMNIPVFMSQNHGLDDYEEDLHNESQLDIAASIKALAKSVHGDKVFGELPRPRFSAQI